MVSRSRRRTILSVTEGTPHSVTISGVLCRHTQMNSSAIYLRACLV